MGVLIALNGGCTFLTSERELGTDILFLPVDVHPHSLYVVRGIL